ncbi:hypothetical protein CPB85DRAFT_1561348 [Mucidula mucida]|nr:hypothetical protein CPB85DRAFT_1561348 [Mucidula mucida]
MSRCDPTVPRWMPHRMRLCKPGFIIDEHSDVADNETVRCQMTCVMDALRNPYKPRPEGEWVGGEITRSFWLNAIRTVTPTAQKRFVNAFQLFTDAVVQEVIERNAHHIRTLRATSSSAGSAVEQCLRLPLTSTP